MNDTAILERITDTPIDEMAIAVEVGLSMPVLKQQLKKLKEQGLVEDNNNGEWRRSPVDENELRRLETKVKNSFYEAGKALAEIRDRQLYRGQYGTFEQYCQDVFGFTRQYAYNQVEAAIVVDDLSTICLQKSLPLPNRESQCRPLKNLPPSDRVSAWELACDLSEDKIPTAKVVKEAVDSLKPKDPVQPWRVGDICIIEVTGDDTKGRRGRWVTVLASHTNTCEITDFTGDTFMARHDELIPYPIENDNADMLRKLQFRLQKLYKSGDTAYFSFIKELGTMRRDWLSTTEEKLLEAMEAIERSKSDYEGMSFVGEFNLPADSPLLTEEE